MRQPPAALCAPTPPAPVPIPATIEATTGIAELLPAPGKAAHLNSFHAYLAKLRFQSSFLSGKKLSKQHIAFTRKRKESEQR